MINSWANKTSWRQKKKKEKKKSSNCAYLLQKKKGKNTAGEGGTAGIYWRGNVMAARAAGSWCPALGSRPPAAAMVTVFNGAVGMGSPPGSCLPAAVQVHRVFASWWVCGSFQQLSFLVAGFLGVWETE